MVGNDFITVSVFYCLMLLLKNTCNIDWWGTVSNDIIMLNKNALSKPHVVPLGPSHNTWLYYCIQWVTMAMGHSLLGGVNLQDVSLLGSSSF